MEIKHHTVVTLLTAYCERQIEKVNELANDTIVEADDIEKAEFHGQVTAYERILHLLANF